MAVVHLIPVFAEHPYFALVIASVALMDAIVVRANSGLHLDGFPSSSVQPVTNCSGVKEVHVLRMRESLTSYNGRAKNDVYLRHPPHCRVLQESS